MRVTRLIPYLCKETISEYKYTLEHRLCIRDKFIYKIYKFYYPCSILICMLHKHISKIKCNKFIQYEFCSNKLNYYTIQLDGKIIC